MAKRVYWFTSQSIFQLSTYRQSFSQISFGRHHHLVQMPPNVPKEEFQVFLSFLGWLAQVVWKCRIFSSMDWWSFHDIMVMEAIQQLCPVRDLKSGYWKCSRWTLMHEYIHEYMEMFIYIVKQYCIVSKKRQSWMHAHIFYCWGGSHVNTGVL